MEMKQTDSKFIKDSKIEFRFANLIKNILGQVFISKELTSDLEQGTDFAIFKVNPFKVAVRLRRFDYFESFYDEFTIRWSRPSGVKTEIHKIRDGLVDYLLYGFLSPDETEIIQYFIADLHKFGNPKPYEIHQNYPKDSELAVYKWNQFPEDFVMSFYCHPSCAFVWKGNRMTFFAKQGEASPK